ncbi:hypothetical protein FQA47_020216, partial [Oryzias melastigma]
NYTGPQPCGLAAIPFDDLSAAFAQRPLPPSVFEEPGAESGLAMGQPLFLESFDGAVEGAASFQQPDQIRPAKHGPDQTEQCETPH